MSLPKILRKLFGPQKKTGFRVREQRCRFCGSDVVGCQGKVTVYACDSRRCGSWYDVECWSQTMNCEELAKAHENGEAKPIDCCQYCGAETSKTYALSRFFHCGTQVDGAVNWYQSQECRIRFFAQRPKPALAARQHREMQQASTSKNVNPEGYALQQTSTADRMRAMMPKSRNVPNELVAHFLKQIEVLASHGSNVVDVSELLPASTAFHTHDIEQACAILAKPEHGFRVATQGRITTISWH